MTNRTKEAVQALTLELEMRDSTLAMTVARLGGIVDGYPTARHNFLQRIDELVAIEAEREQLLGLVQQAIMDSIVTWKGDVVGGMRICKDVLSRISQPQPASPEREQPVDGARGASMSYPIPDDLRAGYSSFRGLIDRIAALEAALREAKDSYELWHGNAIQVQREKEALDVELREAKQESERLEESKCSDCSYPREKHCKGIGLTEEQENQYIPCEYCFLKESYTVHTKRIKELEDLLDHLLSILGIKLHRNLN
jgi:hypothetical protein